MKRLFFLLLAGLGCALITRAQQLPNNSFERWDTSTGRDIPEGWLTVDDLLLAQFGVPANTGTTTRTTAAQHNQYAARLENYAVAAYGQVPGQLALGTSVDPATSRYSGLPFTSRPTALQLYYQLTGPDATTDSAAAWINLTRFVGGRRETVGEGLVYLEPAATYTALTLPVRYYSAATPDSIHLVFSSGAADNLGQGTVLLLDNIRLSYTPLATQPAQAGSSLTLYPNPSRDGRFTLAAGPTEPALAGAALAVYDPLGRLVLSEPAATLPTAGRRLDLHAQPAGVYTLRLATASGPVTRRLTIE